jgi:hypothetical protein
MRTRGARTPLAPRVSDRLLRLDGARDAVGGAEEGGHDAVAGRLHDRAVMASDDILEDGLVAEVQLVGEVVAEPGSLRGGVRRGR